MPFGHHARDGVDHLLPIQAVVGPVLVLDAELEKGRGAHGKR